MTALAVAMAAESGANANGPGAETPGAVVMIQRGVAAARETGTRTPLFYRDSSARTRGAVP
jgi:hypothetical protein